MNNPFDNRLNGIIEKHGCIPPDIISSTQINAIIADVLTRRCINKTVAIWGVGKKNAVNGHCAMIINKYILYLGGLKYLIDSDMDLRGGKFMGYPVISPEDVCNTNIDIVIIASKGSRKNIRDNILKIAPQCEYIDIYEELENAGLKIDFNFFNEQNVYTELYRYKDLYQKALTENEREDYLDKLIALYLKIRDFYYAKHFIDEYIKAGYSKSSEYGKMMEEIDGLCDEVKKINAGRKDDIMIHLVDSMRAMDVYGRDENGNFKLNMFKTYQQDAVVYTEAYSTGSATYESMLGTIKQKLPFEENVYEDNHFIFDIEEFELLDRLHKQKMPIRFYVSEEYRIMNRHEDITMVEQLHMPEKLWTIACDLAVADKPTFCFSYYPWELHFPMLCGYMHNEPKIKQFADVGLEDMSDFIERQHKDCMDYVDKQFAYYQDFYSRDSLLVLMADHSQPIYDPKRNVPYFMFNDDKDRVSHVTFMMIDRRLEAGVHDELISMLDFNKIMEAAVFDKKVLVPGREIIRYQYYNVQNKRLRENAMQRGFMNYTEGINCFLSKEYLYVKTGTGIRKVFRTGDNETDIKDTPEGKAYMEHVEETFFTEFPKFWTIRNEV